jgi:hypothetical protein
MSQAHSSGILQTNVSYQFGTVILQEQPNLAVVKRSQLYILHIPCIRLIFIIYNLSLLHLLTNNIYVVLFYSVHSATCFTLNKPPSGGFNYKGKPRCVLT